MSFLRMLVMLGFVLFITSAGADMTRISPGGVVFIGEEGLDISASGVTSGGQLAWWAPGSARSSSPADTISVPDPTSFYVAPSTFSGEEGPWYVSPSGQSAFNAKSPKLRISIYDETAGFDATGKWIPRGDVASFRIESNLYEAGRRDGSSGAPVDIVIKSPEGGEYTSVQGPGGYYSLTGIKTTSSLYNTGPVWNTRSVDSGTYEIYAKAGFNSMSDNNPSPGTGVSETITVLIQDVNPLISNSKTETQTPVETISPENETPSIEPASSERTPVQATTSLPTLTTVPVWTEQPGVTMEETPVHTQAPAPVQTPVPSPTPTKAGIGLLLPVISFFCFLLFRRV